jgi:linoleoyl-CoA desaturase
MVDQALAHTAAHLRLRNPLTNETILPGALLHPAPTAPPLGLRQVLRPSGREIACARRRLHGKALLIGALAASSYGLLVFGRVGVGVRLLSAAVLVVALVATATGVMHDANHGAFSRSRRLNRVVGFSGDLLGGSSWLWRVKHNTLHHASPNVMGVDTDIEQMPFARLAPEQPWRRWHRAQHLYLWFLYGFMALSWLLISDIRTVISGRQGDHALPRRPKFLEVVTIAGGKVLHLTWAVVIPLLFCPVWAVVVFYLACSWCVGFALAVMFQVAHCVEEAEFTTDNAPRRPDFVAQQLRSTVDVRIDTPVVGRFLRWWMGGLDHQVEHHLAPRLPHTIYPLLAARIDGLPSAPDLARRCHASLGAALRSHARWLRLMGQKPVVAGLR